MALSREELREWGEENWTLPEAKEAWKDWYEYRSELGKPLKTYAGLKAIKKLFSGENEKYLAVSVSTSITNEWQGLFLRKDDFGDERRVRNDIMEDTRKGRKVAL